MIGEIVMPSLPWQGCAVVARMVSDDVIIIIFDFDFDDSRLRDKIDRYGFSISLCFKNSIIFFFSPDGFRWKKNSKTQITTMYCL